MNDISITLIVSNTCSKSTVSQHEPCSHVLVNWGHSFSAESCHPDFLITEFQERTCLFPQILRKGFT